MGKLRFGKILDSICMSAGSGSSYFCGNNNSVLEGDDQDEFEAKPLVDNEEFIRLKDEFDKPKTLAFQLKPKTVVLRVSMHCYGCAKKVEKHISKIEGVTSYQVDLETKMVVVIGDIMPFEVLESISKVKNAQLWTLSPVDRA
ncbi:protein SODIUM POTASSIUM ROOT DEFECTIVE 2 [Impatiens glandulifera]|uniref:protein SODIUM POTASSIUM ROOT DEFECTIVE 2 n=1 Tax=Impatiens glandulifera TaxID=253017 RepID=UPI001FB0CE1B|nr:protein SODIUM POTASSIUM ROOT DEFECTIVE 2 [Impatiens glandulifera]